MKVKVFRFTVCECQGIGRPPRMERTGLTPSEIEARVNSFCETVNVVSISAVSYTHLYLVKVIEETMASEWNGIKNPFYGYVTIQAHKVFYAK